MLRCVLVAAVHHALVIVGGAQKRTRVRHRVLQLLGLVKTKTDVPDCRAHNVSATVGGARLMTAALYSATHHRVNVELERTQCKDLINPDACGQIAQW